MTETLTTNLGQKSAYAQNHARKIQTRIVCDTGHLYTTTKKTMSEKFSIKKFDPVARKHVLYEETKLK